MKVGRLIFKDLPRYKLHIKNISIVNCNKIEIELNSSENAPFYTYYTQMNLSPFLAQESKCFSLPMI